MHTLLTLKTPHILGYLDKYFKETCNLVNMLIADLNNLHPAVYSLDESIMLPSDACRSTLPAEFLLLVLHQKTRMYSSRMRTARSSSRRGGGCFLPGGSPCWGGAIFQGGASFLGGSPCWDCGTHD